ncbi:probable carboxylesterase 18 [Ananas comosus]|uniref:Probable carboxylesterase 18 n=1 Tax=Ananas comosus TaxID=4615 RepID=A0A6P5GHP8_ANACO|nr:probable carboxylesterase 18 [Ananas comosus]
MAEKPPTPKRRQKTPSPPMSWKLRLSLSVLSAVTDASRRPDGTLNRRLLSFLDIRAAANPKPVRGVRSVDLTVDPSRKLWIRVFSPASAAAAGDRQIPVIIFFHGGGFAYLSAASRYYDLVCRRICRRIPAIVASVNYRLSPEHRFPAQYDDGFDVLRFIDSGGLGSGAVPDGVAPDLSSCFLAGDSAGGNIAHHVARRYSAAIGSWHRLRLAGLVAIQPFFGGEERTESEIRLAGAPLVSMDRTDWLWKAFLPEGADRNHEAAHVCTAEAAAELGEGFPPTMVVIGGFDPLQDWQRRYYEALKGSGREVRLVEYPNAIHAFYVFPEFEDSGKLLEEIKGFVEAHRAKGKQEEDANGGAS